MKAKEAVIIAAIIIVISALGTFLAHTLYTSWYYLDEYSVPITFTVVEPQRVGFNLNTTAITFGKVPQGQLANRDIFLGSEVRARGYIKVHPPLDNWVSPRTNPVDIEPNTEVKVAMLLAIPEDAAPGNYSGSATITYFRRLPWE